MCIKIQETTDIRVIVIGFGVSPPLFFSMDSFEIIILYFSSHRDPNLPLQILLMNGILMIRFKDTVWNYNPIYHSPGKHFLSRIRKQI